MIYGFSVVLRWYIVRIEFKSMFKVSKCIFPIFIPSKGIVSNPPIIVSFYTIWIRFNSLVKLPNRFIVVFHPETRNAMIIKDKCLEFKLCKIISGIRDGSERVKSEG